MRKESPHCKKRLTNFPSPAGMSLTKLSPGREYFNYFWPERLWLVTSRPGTGKLLTFFTVHLVLMVPPPSTSNSLKACLSSAICSSLHVTAFMHVRGRAGKGTTEEERKRRGRHKPLEDDVIGSLGCRKWGT